MAPWACLSRFARAVFPPGWAPPAAAPRINCCKAAMLAMGLDPAPAPAGKLRLSGPGVPPVPPPGRTAAAPPAAGRGTEGRGAVSGGGAVDEGSGGRGSGGGSGGSGTPSTGMHTTTRFITCFFTAAGHLEMNRARLARYRSGVMPPSGSVGDTSGRPLAKATPSAEAPLARADQCANGTWQSGKYERVWDFSVKQCRVTCQERQIM